MQNDGNFVLYSRDGTALWASESKGKGGVRVDMQDDGNLVIYNSKNQPVWSTNALRRGQTLLHGQAIYSPNGNYRALLSMKGYFRVEANMWDDSWEERWGPGSYGDRISFQDDGNLVIYQTGNPTWSSGTHGKGGVIVEMQNDGNLVMHDSKGNTVWQSK